MEICFVSLSDERLQMYYEGKRLGAPLTDNAPGDDGYRYHDILHLAFVAKLGWSPVLRELLGRKRKSDREVDEVQDGARATIIEEAVLNAFHAEGDRQAKLRPPGETPSPDRFFATSSEISFDLLRLVENFVRDLEVKESQYWEWESAIYDGFQIFYELREERQGTIRLDLEERSIDFRPTFSCRIARQGRRHGVRHERCDCSGSGISGDANQARHSGRLGDQESVNEGLCGHPNRGEHGSGIGGQGARTGASSHVGPRDRGISHHRFREVGAAPLMRGGRNRGRVLKATRRNSRIDAFGRTSPSRDAVRPAGSYPSATWVEKRVVRRRLER